MTKDFQEMLIDVTVELITQRGDLFTLLSSSEYSNMGIENWLQTEFILALTDRGYIVKTEGKVKRGCDIIVYDRDNNEFLVELKASTTTSYSYLQAEGFDSHPKADTYLFVGRVTEKSETMLKKNIRGWEDEGFLIKYHIDSGWVSLVARRT
ncbi:MAG: hypothetical protein ACW99G_21300 [Candidatus Thorarchaeota archaeon]|jgi:hypothetical protein